MENEKPSFESITSQVKEYVNTRVDLLMLTATDKASAVTGSAITYFLLFIIGMFITLFLSIGAALGIGYCLKSYIVGFLSVAFFYILLGVIVWINREKWIKAPVINAMIKAIFKVKNGN